VTRRDDIYYGIANRLFFRRERPQNVPPLVILPHTSKSLSEIIAYLRQLGSFDYFELDADFSAPARSMIVAAHYSAIISLLDLPPIEIGPIDRSAAFLTLLFHFLGESSRMRTSQGVVDFIREQAKKAGGLALKLVRFVMMYHI
jgi:hypothetical protein